MSAATLSSLLPTPRYSSLEDDGKEQSGASQSNKEDVAAGPSTSPAITTRIPPYGSRAGWKPKSREDFGNGGAYPECHIAQYPLEMGRKGKSNGRSGGSLTLQVDGEGNVRYDAIVHQGRREGQLVQSQHKDLIPLSQRDDKDSRREMARPSEEDVLATTERTRAALEKLTQGKIKSAQSRAGAGQKPGESTYIRYTPGDLQGNTDGSNQRIIKMTEQTEDPLAPPRWKFKKIPQGPPSPPAPVLRSPPRKATAQEQKDWMIPPCISNWKNNKGYTIPLDKRLAADGRGLQDVHINDGFAQFSEALNLADRHAREEVRQRAMMQQKLAAKEKAAREEHLRQLAQRARDERSGMSSVAPSTIDDDDSSSRLGADFDRGNNGKKAAGLGAAMAGYASDSDGSDSEDEQAARERDRLREERKREREREMRMSNMGTEQRARMLAREENRDISEKVALGLAKPTSSSDQIDSRLFNQEQLSGTFGDDESYNAFDKPLFSGAEAAAAMYRRPAGKGGADDIYANADIIEEETMKNDRFGLGKSKGFQGAEFQEQRSGPVQFEKDTSDPFSIDQFLDEAKRGTKRGGMEESNGNKRRREGSFDD